MRVRLLQIHEEAIRGSVAKQFLVLGQCNVRVRRLNQERDLSLVEIKLICGVVASCRTTRQYFTEDSEITAARRNGTKNRLLTRSAVDQSQLLFNKQTIAHIFYLRMAV